MAHKALHRTGRPARFFEIFPPLVLRAKFFPSCSASRLAANVTIHCLLGASRLTTGEFSRLSLPQTAFGAGFAPDSRRLCEEMTYEIDGRRVSDTFDRD